MAFSLHGVKVPKQKNTASLSAVRMPAPESVTIIMQMHIGAPAVPVVKAGDKVSVGTLIAKEGGAVSAPVYSSISGTVKKIDNVVLSDSGMCPAITIVSDGEMSIDENVKAPTVDSKEALVNAIKESGIVGLGGAGFPTYIKYDFDEIDALIINGAECEPYITSDTRTMLDRVEDMRLALTYFEKYFKIGRIIIGVEKHNKEALASMKKLAEDFPSASVKVLPNKYPQGAEKVLIYSTTGKVIKKGTLPIDAGVIVSNCTTVADIGKYIRTGMPLVEKCVTVDGSAVNNPMNVYAPIGTAFSDVIEFTGGFRSEPEKLISGGPMMGVSVPELSYPVLKNTNAILAFDKKHAVLAEPKPCIKCGRCIDACPFGINVPQLAKAFEHKDVEAMIKCGGEVCMECGCCSFVCPANRPSVQTHKLVKAEIRKAINKAKEAK